MATDTKPPSDQPAKILTLEERSDALASVCASGIHRALEDQFHEAQNVEDPPTEGLLRECLKTYILSWTDHNVPKGPLPFKQWRARRQNRVAAAGDPAHAVLGTVAPAEVFEYPGDLYVHVEREGRPKFRAAIGDRVEVDEDLSNIEGELYVEYRSKF
jgi:hypothetical protein